MAHLIQSIRALEILDSRGNPTLRVTVELQDGTRGTAKVPAGASTGTHEAKELRDNSGSHKGASRYGGKGVRRAVASMGQISQFLRNMEVTNQRALDLKMIALDGTTDKSRLGANAILGVSMAAAVAASRAMGQSLYAYLGGPVGSWLPVPMMNVINGGRHAENSLDFQEFMIVPHGAPSYGEAMRFGVETYQALKGILKARNYSVAVGDEGGFAPDLKSNREACDLILEAIEMAGLRPGHDVSLALDPAASSFRTSTGYDLKKSGEGEHSSDQLSDLYARWAEDYPIVSIEDGFAEDDWRGFAQHTAKLGGKLQIVGDDLYVTNVKFIERGITEKATNAVLIKLNQIGTVSETMDAIQMCRGAGWKYIISHRSGETDDTFISDFAVATGARQIKAGAPCRGERVAKYNRLLEIENELGASARFADPYPRSARRRTPSHHFNPAA
jgi:enolase